MIPQLISGGFISSKSEFLRLIKQGGVRLNSEKLADGEVSRKLSDGAVLKIGKKRFVQFSND